MPSCKQICPPVSREGPPVSREGPPVSREGPLPSLPGVDWLPVVACQASRRCLLSESRSPAPNRLLPRSVDGCRGKQTADRQVSAADRRQRPRSSVGRFSAKQGGKGPVRKRSDKLLSVADIQGPLVEKDNLPGYTLPPFASSSLKPADLQRIFEEQTARSARSRREAIEDFHWVCGW